MAQRTMQRLQDLGIKDVYNGLNENSSSTLQAMGTLYTEPGANTLDYSDGDRGAQQKPMHNNENRTITFSSDISTMPSKRTKRSGNENQNYGTAIQEHQRQLSRQTFNRGSTSTGDNFNVFSDMTNVTHAGDNVKEQLIRPEPIQMKKLGKSQGVKKTRNTKVQKASSTN